jgi:hypothetical protein
MDKNRFGFNPFVIGAVSMQLSGEEAAYCFTAEHAEGEEKG